jgi:hypothetical protein
MVSDAAMVGIFQQPTLCKKVESKIKVDLHVIGVWIVSATHTKMDEVLQFLYLEISYIYI